MNRYTLVTARGEFEVYSDTLESALATFAKDNSAEVIDAFEE